MTGEQVNKYRILEILGEGATAKVYLARDLHLDRLVAVKRGKEGFLPAEMQLLKELEHSGLPKIYDFFTWEGNSCLVMEYVEGISLREYLKRYGRVTQTQAVKWCLELCQILAFLHRARPSVVYRDLKPENIMIRPDGTLKLIDLGAAARAAFGRGSEELCMGTPGYSPPEQWQSGKAECTQDIFAVGALLHEMLTGVNPGKPPFERRPVREYDRSLSAGLEKFLNTCMRREPEKRYPSMEEAILALESCAGTDKRKRAIWRVKQLIRWCCAFAAVFWTLAPLLRGMERSSIPFPYLEKPLLFLLLTLCLRLFWGKRQKNGIRHIEKTLCLTEKQFPGLYIGMWAAVGAGLAFSLFAAQPVSLRAVEAKEPLWVEMRDEENRKLLLKEGACYETETEVRLEIPASRLPGERISLQLVAVGESGSIYSSRIFHIAARGDGH